MRIRLLLDLCYNEVCFKEVAAYFGTCVTHFIHCQCLVLTRGKAL